MKKAIFILFALVSFAQAQDSSQVKARKNPIKEFKIWVNGQLLNADNLDVLCVEDDLETYANFRYTLKDSTGMQLANGFLKMEGQTYQQYLTQARHGERATAWVMQQLNIQQRAQRQAIQAAKAAATVTQ